MRKRGISKRKTEKSRQMFDKMAELLDAAENKKHTNTPHNTINNTSEGQLPDDIVKALYDCINEQIKKQNNE